MRRKDKEIIELSEIESIINRSLVCRLAMSDENGPYMVPLCFGYHDNSLYFHCANTGKKIDMIQKNKRVCFEFDIDCEIIKTDKPCKWTMKYKSVIGFGNASLIKDLPSRQKALDIIIGHYGGKSFAYSESKIKNITVIKVSIESMTGKSSG